jgi:hypothetical protein
LEEKILLYRIEHILRMQEALQRRQDEDKDQGEPDDKDKDQGGVSPDDNAGMKGDLDPDEKSGGNEDQRR